MARVEVPAALRPAEHLPGTWRLRLSGPGAPTARPEQIGAALLSSGKIRSMDVWKQVKYYRLQSPFDRYVSFGGTQEMSALHQLRHGDKIEAVFDSSAGTKASIEIYNLEERETRFQLQFVPPGASRAYVEALLNRAGIEPTECQRSAVRQDHWFCAADCSREEVPHYITSRNLTNKPLPEASLPYLYPYPVAR